MRESALPDPILRFALADVVYPSGIRGVFRRVLYLLFAFPLIGIVILTIGVAAPGYLVLGILGSLGAPAWLELSLVVAALAFSLLWLASAFAAGLSWVAAARVEEEALPPAGPE